MLKIRLMRIGAKKKPFYRVVAVDERAKRTGAYLDLLGTYNPLTEPKDIKLDKVKLVAWLKKGAQKSDGLLRMLKEAPQRSPRKPKKEKVSKEAEVSKVSDEEKTKESKATEEKETSDASVTPEPSKPSAPATEPATDETPPAEETKAEVADTAESPTTDIPKKEKPNEGPA